MARPTIIPQQHKDFVRANYGKMSYSQMSKVINRSVDSIKNIAKRIGAVQDQTVFTPEMIAAIKERYLKMDAKVLAAELGITTAQLYNKASSMGCVGKEINRYEDADKDYIAANWGKIPMKEIAAACQRTTTAIYKAVAKMRKAGYVLKDMRGVYEHKKKCGAVTYRIVKGEKRKFERDENGNFKMVRKGRRDSSLPVGSIVYRSQGGKKFKCIKCDDGIFRRVKLTKEERGQRVSTAAKARSLAAQQRREANRKEKELQRQEAAKERQRIKELTRLKKIEDRTKEREAKRAAKAPKHAPAKTIRQLPTRTHSVLAIVRGFRDGREVEKAEVEREHNIEANRLRMEARGLKVEVELKSKNAA